MADPTVVSVNFAQDLFLAIKRRARDSHFGDVSCYIHWLAAKDALPNSQDANLEVALIKEGLASGPGHVADEAFFRELTEETDRIIERNAAAGSARAAG